MTFKREKYIQHSCSASIKYGNTYQMVHREMEYVTTQHDHSLLNGVCDHTKWSQLVYENTQKAFKDKTTIEATDSKHVRTACLLTDGETCGFWHGQCCIPNYCLPQLSTIAGKQVCLFGYCCIWSYCRLQLLSTISDRRVCCRQLPIDEFVATIIVTS